MKLQPLVLGLVLALVSTAFAEQTKISNPVHPGSNLPILSYSNHDGICKMLGFEKAVSFSVVRSDKGPNAKPGMIFGLSVDTNGRVHAYDRMYGIGEITCMNYDPAFIVPEESKEFINPVHPQSGLPFAYLDRSVKARDQICQILGMDRSARGLDWPLLSSVVTRATLVHDTRDIQDIDAPTFSKVVCVKVNPLAPLPPPPVVKTPPEVSTPPVEVETPKQKPSTTPDEKEETQRRRRTSEELEEN